MTLRKICTIIHSSEGEEKGSELWANKNLRAYMEKHGKHFNEKLSSHASKEMENKDKSKHYWSLAEVKQAFEGMGYRKPCNVTWADVHYLANMAFADYYQDTAKCFEWVNLFLSDPDGYDEKAFTHYLADLMEEEETIEWSEMI